MGIKAIDKNLNSHDINLERIISEIKSQTYDGQFDNTLMKLFVWISYPLVNPDTDMGYVIADNVDQANEIISRLSLQSKIDIDYMCTLYVYRMYDFVMANKSLMKNINDNKPKIYLFTIIEKGKKQVGVVIAKRMIEAKRILQKNGVKINETLTFEELNPKEKNFFIFQ